jgi:hypothetical protein
MSGPEDSGDGTGAVESSAASRDVDGEVLERTTANGAVVASDFAEANPPAIDIPSMICPQERNFYYWIASNHAPGVGAVVEFGTWLGGSTAHLSAGLRGRAMHCYDNFLWYEDDNSKSDVKLKEGDDFFPLFAANIGRYGANVIVHRSTIADFTWEDGPIELLVVDAPKLAADFARLLTVFAPCLIPGQTRIVLQDYQHFPSYQISVVMDAIRASAALEHVVVAVNSNRQPNTVSFLVTSPIDIAAIEDVALGLKTWSSERIHATWSRIMAPLPDQARARMAPGLALFLYDAGHEDEALGVLAETPMDKTMLKRWKRMGELKHAMAGIRPSDSYPRLYRLMQETRLDPTRAIPNAKRQENLFLAVSLDRDADPRRYLAAWKQVLAQSSPRSNAAKRAAKRIVSVADEVGEPSDVVDGLIALLEIAPEDRGTRERLASAAIGALPAQKALDCLARHGLADLAAPKIDSLHARVCRACEDAARAGDTGLALSLFRSLERVDDRHARVEALRPSLAAVGPTSA